MLPAKLYKGPHHDGNCEWLFNDGTRCNAPLTIEDKVCPFYMRTIGGYGDKLEKMMFASIKDTSKWSGVGRNALRNPLQKTTIMLLGDWINKSFGYSGVSIVSSPAI